MGALIRPALILRYIQDLNGDLIPYRSVSISDLVIKFNFPEVSIAVGIITLQLKRLLSVVGIWWYNLLDTEKACDHYGRKPLIFLGTQDGT